MKENPKILLERYIRARYPIVALTSHEERRVLTQIRDVAAVRHMGMFEWSLTTGWVNCPVPGVYTTSEKIDPDQTIDPGAALAALIEYPVKEDNGTIFVMKDLHALCDRSKPQPKITRWLRDVAARFESSRHSLILLSPDYQVPADLEKTIAVMDWPLPTREELTAVLESRAAELPPGIPDLLVNGNRDRVVQALQGLTTFEAESVLLSGMVATRELSDKVIPFIIQEKSQIIRKAGVLEYYDNPVTMQDVGGLTALKAYAARKRVAFSSRAQEAGLDAPRGLLLVGVPGTGKSLAAKAIAGAFQMPLLRMDVGALMGGLVGQSEANTRAAFKVAEAVSPCVLWIDEIEKGLGGSGGERDGGTSSRVFGSILTWMQEKTAPVYVVATANDISSLRPELISRFDDVYFVDLPAQADREAILRVHLEKRRQPAALLDLGDVASALWGYSGREIEKVVRAGVEAAFCRGDEMTPDDLIVAAGELVPVTVTMRDQIDRIRSWAKTSQARQAAEPLDPQPEATAVAVRAADFY